MALPTKWALDLTCQIALLERLATSHAYSMSRYGAFSAPYSSSGEFAGALENELLNRSYIYFAKHARTHFISITYFFLPSGVPPLLSLPLGNIRVVHGVGYAPATLFKAVYGGGPTQAEARAPWVMVAAPGTTAPGAGDTLVQVAATPFQRPDYPLIDQNDSITQYPEWRIVPSGWNDSVTQVGRAPLAELSQFLVGTQAASVLVGEPRISLTVPVTNFMARGLVTSPGGSPAEALAEFYPVYVPQASNAYFSNFARFSGGLQPLTANVMNMPGGTLTIVKDDSSPTEFSSSLIVGVIGEVGFRPAITLDRPEATAAGGTRRPDTNRLTPLMLYPVPAYEQLQFLQKFHVAVGQAMFVSHLSADDSRYPSEMAMLQQMTEGVSVMPEMGVSTSLSMLSRM